LIAANSPSQDLVWKERARRANACGLNGRQLAARARRIRPDLKVLFTSGYARNAIVHQGRLDPGVELLSKPFTLSQLAAKIRQIRDRGERTRAN
jgi:CheY-like chemotaxis protein